MLQVQVSLSHLGLDLLQIYYCLRSKSAFHFCLSRMFDDLCKSTLMGFHAANAQCSQHSTVHRLERVDEGR